MRARVRPQVPEGVLRSVPMRRVMGPVEVAGAVAWLLSAQSSDETGIARPIGGGWVTQ